MRLDKTKPKDRILLILDLDETLIHASNVKLDRDPDFEIFGYYVYRRPGLEAFLTLCFKNFYVAIWSSASDDDVHEVIRRIIPQPLYDQLQFVWGRSRATSRRFSRWSDEAIYYDRKHFHYIKALSKVRKQGWHIERMLIVDDTPEKCVRNYGNAIYPMAFEGDPEDDELEILGRYLLTLKTKEDVRHIEKRNWRMNI